MPACGEDCTIEALGDGHMLLDEFDRARADWLKSLRRWRASVAEVEAARDSLAAAIQAARADPTVGVSRVREAEYHLALADRELKAAERDAIRLAHATLEKVAGVTER